MHRSTLLIALAYATSQSFAADMQYLGLPERGQCCAVIAHAAGAIDGNALTNSRDAMEANIAIGTRLFEIDLSPTSDGVLVATHDWKNWHAFTGTEGSEPPTLTDFKAAPIKALASAHGIPGTYQPMTFSDLESILVRHPSARVVTDTKYELSSVIAAVSNSRVRDQFIIQAYTFEDVDVLIKAGYSGRIILTIYKMMVAYEEGAYMSDFLEGISRVSDDLYGVTVPLSFAARGNNVELIKEKGPMVFIHGQPNEINSRQVLEKMTRLGVSGAYLD